MEPINAVDPTAGVHQADRADTIARLTAADLMGDPRRPTAVHEALLIIAELTVVRRPRTEAGLLVTVAEPMAGQLLPMEEADQLLLTVGAAAPVVLAEAAGMRHQVAGGVLVAAEVIAAEAAEATAADTAKPKRPITQKPSLGTAFLLPGEKHLSRST